jgi:hypothetical protein
LDSSDGDGRDFLADAVTGDDGDASVGTAGTERKVRHGEKVAKKRERVQRCMGVGKPV